MTSTTVPQGHVIDPAERPGQLVEVEGGAVPKGVVKEGSRLQGLGRQRLPGVCSRQHFGTEREEESREGGRGGEVKRVAGRPGIHISLTRCP